MKEGKILEVREEAIEQMKARIGIKLTYLSAIYEGFKKLGLGSLAKAQLKKLLSYATAEKGVELVVGEFLLKKHPVPAGFNEDKYIEMLEKPEGYEEFIELVELNKKRLSPTVDFRLGSVNWVYYDVVGDSFGICPNFLEKLIDNQTIRANNKEEEKLFDELQGICKKIKAFGEKYIETEGHIGDWRGSLSLLMENMINYNGKGGLEPRPNVAQIQKFAEWYLIKD